MAAQSEGSPWQRAKRYGSNLVYKGFVPLLPDALYHCIQPIGLNRPLPWSCIHPDFARRYRRDVRALRGPGHRECARIRQWQIGWFDLGHMTQRIEAWATSGGRKGLTYGYPLLDKRLLIFCLGVPTEYLYRDGRRRVLFRRAIQGLVPEKLRQKSRKGEPANMAILVRLVPEAMYRMFEQTPHRESDSPVAAYIDIDKLEEVLREKEISIFRGGVIRHTVACFGVRALTGERRSDRISSQSFTDFA